MDMIDRDEVLKNIDDLEKSPWFNKGKNLKNLTQYMCYLERKEAVEVVRDLCIKNVLDKPDKKCSVDIGKRLNIALQRKDMKQIDLAVKMGCSIGAISRYLSNQRQPSYADLVRICQILDCSSDYLLGLKDDF